MSKKNYDDNAYEDEEEEEESDDNKTNISKKEDHKDIPKKVTKDTGTGTPPKEINKTIPKIKPEPKEKKELLDFDKLEIAAEMLSKKALSHTINYSSNQSLNDSVDVYFNCLYIIDIHYFKWETSEKLETSSDLKLVKFPIDSCLPEILFERIGLEYVKNKFYNREELLKIIAEWTSNKINDMLTRSDCIQMKTELVSILEILNDNKFLK